MMKLVCEIMVNGEAQTKVLTTATGIDVGAFVIQKPGIGKPYYVFNTLPGAVLAADYEGAPIVSSDKAENNRNIQAMLNNPPFDKLTFA
jgi:hypothetical protein